MRVVRSIVLVDDDKDDQEIFRTACSAVDKTAKVLGFESGEQAVESLTSRHTLPDIIFLDLNMPRMNGVEVLRLFKHNIILKDVPVIIYTTSFDNLVKEECINLGAFDVIEKPSSFESLCALINSVFQTIEI